MLMGRLQDGGCYNGSMKNTYKDIFIRQTFTLFNLVNLILALLILWTGSYQNLFFVGTVVTNWLIGMVQEVKARHTLNKLALLHQNTYIRLEKGREVSVLLSDIRPGDRLLLKGGDQVPCDGVLESGQLDLDESLLTGESGLVVRKAGDPVLSGTLADSGQAVLKVEKAGEDTYVARMKERAMDHKRYPSQLRDAVNTIIKFCTLAIFPMGILLMVRAYLSSGSLKEAILHSAAALIGMIPEGLVVLASITLALAVMRLARQDVLAQELYCPENLARTDILCLDKTGTLTTGKMRVDQVVPVHTSRKRLEEIVTRLFSAVGDRNLTAEAVRKRFGTVRVDAEDIVPFSSRTRFCRARIDGHVYAAGAVQALASAQASKAQAYASRGLRVLAMTEDGQFLGFLVLSDQLKPDARKTLDYFRAQSVELCVISGDDPATVGWVAHEAGIEGTPVNMAGVSEKEIPELVKKYRIFGRTDPEQKAAMVKALQGQGHTVAMTGDGVNDVLALKQADCSIAMGSGSQAARTVASLILLNDQFDDLPEIVLQGRRAINNVQRTASLFLVKTMFSFGLALCTILFFGTYPFQPVQLTLISALATGIPSFVLTLEPNDRRVKGKFLSNVLMRAVPGALNLVLFIMIGWLFFRQGADEGQFGTICTVLAGVNALAVLTMVCRPMTRLRAVLVAGMSAGFAAAIVCLPGLLLLEPLTTYQMWVTGGLCVLEPFVLLWLERMAVRRVQ